MIIYIITVFRACSSNLSYSDISPEKYIWWAKKVFTGSAISIMVVVTSEPLGCVSILTSVFLRAWEAMISLLSLLRGWIGGDSELSRLIDWVLACSVESFLRAWAAFTDRGAFLGTKGLGKKWNRLSWNLGMIMRFKKHSANQMNLAAYGESWFKRKEYEAMKNVTKFWNQKKSNLNWLTELWRAASNGMELASIMNSNSNVISCFALMPCRMWEKMGCDCIHQHIYTFTLTSDWVSQSLCWKR